MLAWLQRHGVHVGPKLYLDSQRLSQDTLERLRPRGRGADPLADRWPLGRNPVQEVDWQ